MAEPRWIDAALLEALSREAAGAPRRRKNHNFHQAGAPGADRLLNAVEPGSYIPPHRHLAQTKDETFVVLRGAFGLVLFDAQGRVTATRRARAGGEVMGLDIPHGTYHTLVSLEPGSVFFEAKAGPYAPLGETERAPWAPAEGEPGAADYLRRLEALFA